jgi:hypothetical protein
MADGECGCIRFVGARQSIEREQPAHHSLHLRLGGRAAAGDRALHHARRVLEDRRAEKRGGTDDDAARLPEGECGAYVLRVDRLLDRDRIGAMPAREADDLETEAPETTRKRLGRG